MTLAQPQSRPTTTDISLKSLLSLPFRLCNPPPPAGKARSCSVTPALRVQLDDILERRHLPPLGLKDFEEWLLYCEDSVENLYFILWLKEYTLRYKQWVARSDSDSYYDPFPRNSLAHFFARAKQTFFTPNAVYELNVPSATLAPFHAVDGSPHPDPAVFTPIAIEIRKMLQDSLERFVLAQLSNVGNSRAFCGMTAGVVFFSIGAVIPIVYNLAGGHSRWLRLTSFPGMWMGLTTLLASLHGVCIGVYIFGDLRQLRKFELSRPPISKPLPALPSPPPPPPRITHPLPAHVEPSNSSQASFESHSVCSDESDDIYVSPAYYDEDDVDGPATNPVAADAIVLPPPPPIEIKEPEDGFVPTAGFIHPYPYEEELEKLPEERQVLSPFDFDALPRHPRHVPKPTLSLQGFIGRMQTKCAPQWVPPTTAEVPSEPKYATESRHRPDITTVKKHLRYVRAVPAFAVPLTPILSEVVVRGQWEIVVRSAILALLLSWVLLGGLLAIPPRP
ncbi:hypothetical protein MIND_00855600 [Mycena indigotica]|uniref:RGS domain-containing protein n=1 Tax=Mycena indigotica TaxID=2126181 RepID=A0A8H6W2B1_9AGAR|nr:uncharacterized protein MIND_00855600 [Mycena indigotica]KAF7299073.1 hypothetical protein MIND_00855600 [Mycena indigotica]